MEGRGEGSRPPGSHSRAWRGGGQQGAAAQGRGGRCRRQRRRWQRRGGSKGRHDRRRPWYGHDVNGYKEHGQRVRSGARLLKAGQRKGGGRRRRRGNESDESPLAWGGANVLEWPSLQQSAQPRQQYLSELSGPMCTRRVTRSHTTIRSNIILNEQRGNSMALGLLLGSLQPLRSLKPVCIFVGILVDSIDI